MANDHIRTCPTCKGYGQVVRAVDVAKLGRWVGSWLACSAFWLILFGLMAVFP